MHPVDTQIRWVTKINCGSQHIPTCPYVSMHIRSATKTTTPIHDTICWFNKSTANCHLYLFYSFKMVTFRGYVSQFTSYFWDPPKFRQKHRGHPSHPSHPSRIVGQLQDPDVSMVPMMSKSPTYKALRWIPQFLRKIQKTTEMPFQTATGSH